MFEYFKIRYERISASEVTENRRKLTKVQLFVWRVTSGLMGFFFLAAAYVQHNDPDPYLWIPVYAVPCILSWRLSIMGAARLSRWDKLWEGVVDVHMLFCLSLGVWTLIWGPAWGHEESRELLGLCLAVVWVSLLRGNTFKDLGRTGLALAICLTLTPILAWIGLEMNDDGNMHYSMC